jgi:hypothetical protein
MSKVEPNILIIFNNKPFVENTSRDLVHLVAEEPVCFRWRAAVYSAGNCGKFSAVNRSAGVLAKTKGIRSQSDNFSSYSPCFLYSSSYVFFKNGSMEKRLNFGTIQLTSLTLLLIKRRHYGFLDCDIEISLWIAYS